MENLKLQKWALTAEIIGGLAVVISIGFVAFELNQNTDEAALNTRVLEIAAFENLTQSIIDINNLVITNSGLSDLINKYSQSKVEDVPVEDRLRLRLLYTNIFRHGSMAYFQYERGAINREQLDSLLSNVQGFAGNSLFALKRLDEMANNFGVEYIEYLKNFMNE